MIRALITFIFRDFQNGETRKTFAGTFADDAALQAAVTSLAAAIQNVVAAGLVRYEVSTVTDVASLAAPNKSVFERGEVATRLQDGGAYTLTIPAPVEGMFSGNAIDPTFAALVTFVDEFDGDGPWSVSDGEQIATLLGGQRGYSASGETNLPA